MCKGSQVKKDYHVLCNMRLSPPTMAVSAVTRYFLDLWNEGVAVTYIKCMSLWSEVAILVIVLGMP